MESGFDDVGTFLTVSVNKPESAFTPTKNWFGFHFDATTKNKIVTYVVPVGQKTQLRGLSSQYVSKL